MKAYVYSILALAFLAVAYAVECPAEDGEFDVLFPNPTNCSTFYKCSGGVPVLINCSDDLEFNAELEVCDWKENAGCSVESNTADDDDSDEEEEEVEEEEDEVKLEQRKKEDKKEDNKWIGYFRRCPKVNGKYAVSIPNHRDCSSFYACDNGKAILMKCPAGLHYNVKKEVCDWPQNAGCRSFIKSTDVVEN